MLALVLALLFVSSLADPTGSYCGVFSTSATLKATVDDSQHADLSGTLYGTALTPCKDEPAYWDKTNNNIIFPNITDPNDCFGSQLASYAISPKDVSVIYFPTQNMLNATIVGIGSALLKPCTTLEATPSGQYCGSYAGAVSVNVTVDTTTTFTISGNIEGVTAFCKIETYALNDQTGIVSFPNINIASDCLGAILMSYGINPSTLQVNYIATTDTLNIAVPDLGAQFSLNHSSC